MNINIYSIIVLSLILLRYTRTLLDKGNGHYNLMLLCWNTGQESPIHNHPNSHCFMKTLKGKIHEEVYKKPNTSSCCQNSDCEMVKIADRDYKVDDVALITGKSFSKACGHSKSIVFGFGWVFQNKIFFVYRQKWKFICN